MLRKETGLAAMCLILMAATPIARADSAYERLWSTCDGQTKPPLDRTRNALRYVGAFADRAALYGLQNNYQEGIAAYNRFFELANQYNVYKNLFNLFYVFRARMYLTAGKYDEAIADCQRADDSLPFTFGREAWTAELRGDIAMATGSYGSALKLYQIVNRQPGVGAKLDKAQTMLERELRSRQ
jgi:tetratricopeptide (TPR) repeat protein